MSGEGSQLELQSGKNPFNLNVAVDVSQPLESNAVASENDLEESESDSTYSESELGSESSTSENGSKDAGSDSSSESEFGEDSKDQTMDADTGNDISKDWNLNAWTSGDIAKGDLTYYAEEQSCVWPPMLLLCLEGEVYPGQINMAVSCVKDLLQREGVEVGFNPVTLEIPGATFDSVCWDPEGKCITPCDTKGIQTKVVEHTECVCWEGHTRYDLFTLSPTGSSFAAAKAVDGFYYGSKIRTHTAYYPSLKDMLDIKNGRVPESSRRFVRYLNCHGMAREAWSGLSVELVRGDGICVGHGLCKKVDPSDEVEGELLGESYVGVQVLDVVEELVPVDWKDSLRRWKMIHVLCNGVSLFECLRQHVEAKTGFYCKKGYYLDPEVVQLKEGVLKDQSLTSVAPWASSFEGGDEVVNRSKECSEICEDEDHDFANDESKRDVKRPRYDGRSFSEKLMMDERLRMEEIEGILTTTSATRTLMEHLGSANGPRMATGVTKRLDALHKFNEPRINSALITTIKIKAAEKMELGTLVSIGDKEEREKQSKIILDGMDIDREKSILAKREGQHKELLKLLANAQANQVSKLEELVEEKFKFACSIQDAKKETESVLDWLSQHTARETDQVKKAHMIEKRMWEEQMTKAEAELQAARRELDEEANAKAKCATELHVARQELDDHKRAMANCGICFESLEAIFKFGQNYSQDGKHAKTLDLF